eukprot:COSAG03_NODE_581_length_6869_cov_71.096750_4_plen_144_part_00
MKTMFGRRSGAALAKVDSAARQTADQSAALMPTAACCAPVGLCKVCAHRRRPRVAGPCWQEWLDRLRPRTPGRVSRATTARRDGVHSLGHLALASGPARTICARARGMNFERLVNLRRRRAVRACVLADEATRELLWYSSPVI